MDPEIIQIYENYRKNWKKIAKEIKAYLESERKLKDLKIFVFGSTVTGKTHPLSDIDILIVSNAFEDIETRINIHTELKMKFGSVALEFHLIPYDKLDFYKKMAKEMVEIK